MQFMTDDCKNSNRPTMRIFFVAERGWVPNTAYRTIVFEENLKVRSYFARLGDAC
jgi:hypothetical protein